MKWHTLCTLAGAPLLMFVQLMVTRNVLVMVGSVGMAASLAQRKGAAPGGSLRDPHVSGDGGSLPGGVRRF